MGDDQLGGIPIQPLIGRDERKQLGRRQFLAGLALGGSALDWTCLLRCAYARSESSASGRGSADSIILFFLAGGLSHLDSFDPKPNARCQYRGEFASINTAVAGVRFCEHLPKLAAAAGNAALLRSVTHSQGDHNFATRYVLTGEKLATPDTPSVAAVAASHWRQMNPPAYAAIPQIGPTAGDLGAAFEAYNVLGDGGALIAESPSAADLSELALYERRGRLLSRLNDRFLGETVPADVFGAWKTTYEQAAELMSSETLRDATNLEAESAKIRDRYGRFAWGDYALIARRLIEAGSRFVVVQYEGWDTHRKNFLTLKSNLPAIDQAISALLEDLDARGRLQRTLVVVLSEFGRTPLVNRAAGRDHWPRAMSVLWCGGGTAAGKVIGETDPVGAEVVNCPVSPEDVAFTILLQLGLDPGETKLPPHGRKLLPTGQIIHDLMP